jgi:hypothetical protein
LPQFRALVLGEFPDAFPHVFLASRPTAPAFNERRYSSGANPLGAGRRDNRAGQIV